MEIIYQVKKMKISNNNNKSNHKYFILNVVIQYPMIFFRKEKR